MIEKTAKRQRDTNAPGVAVNYFQQIWTGQRPLARMFKTDGRGYLYDTGTNKIIGCDEYTYALLDRLLSGNIDNSITSYISRFGKKKFTYAAAAIKNAIEAENILLTCKINGFGLHNSQEYNKLVDRSLETLILEVTENCNLSCDYCVYNPTVKSKRNHGNNNMPTGIAREAIDYLCNHSIDNKSVSIVFYGGEPLLNYPFIRSCVEYSKGRIVDRKINFLITTNAVLLNPGIADFFFKNDFSVFVSIDGPGDIHDGYRKNKRGEGSYREALAGLKDLVDTYGAYAKEKLRLSMVYTPPFGGEKLDRIADLWSEVPWLPEDIGIEISYPSPGTIPIERMAEESHKEDIDLLQWSYELFKKKSTEQGAQHPISKSIVEKKFAQLMQRPIFPNAAGRCSLNGCCIPGVEKLFVSTNGTFRVCEKIASDAPTIGSISSGIGFDSIKKFYLDGYEAMCTLECGNCWSARLCTLCYDHSLLDGKLDLKTRRNHCGFEKNMNERILSYFCSLLEKDPGCLDYLYDLNLKSKNHDHEKRI